jgi:hypothetical protein
MTATAAARSEPASHAYRYFADLVAQAADREPQDHVLPYLYLPPFGPWILRDGVQFIDLVTQREWETIYSELTAAGPRPARFPGLDEVQARARAATDGTVAIGIANIRYKRPSRRLGHALTRAERDNAAVDLPEDTPTGMLFEEKTAFVASAILPPVHSGFERQPDIHVGLQVRFRVAHDLYLSNGAHPDRLAIDFDDGFGFRDIAFGEECSIDYDAPGERRIVLRAQFGTSVLTGSFQFATAEPRFNDKPQAEFADAKAGPHFEVRVPATIPYDGKLYSGVAYVYRGRGNDAARGLRHPILLAEGFPGGARPDDIYDIFNGKTSWGRNERPNNLADELRWRGYDIVILIFSETGAPIQGNAFVYLEALRWISGNIPVGRSFGALGGSMGGLIARYALAYAETNNVPLGNVTTLMTFDSPHCGANVPLAVQAAARYFRFRAPEPAKLFDYACAKQMLLHQFWDTGAPEPVVKPEFTGFYAELERLGKKGDGYPSAGGIKKYALCNGADYGGTVIPAAARALKVWRDGSPNYYIDLYCTPNNATGDEFTYAVCEFSGYARTRYYLQLGSEFRTRDGCSGGLQNFFEQVFTATSCASGWEDPYPRSCFVPAYSAIGVRGVNDAYPFRATDYIGKTPFDDWYAPKVNQQHCTIDKGSLNWVLDKFPRPENTD